MWTTTVLRETSGKNLTINMEIGYNKVNFMSWEISLQWKNLNMMVQAFKGKDSGCEAKIVSSFRIDYVP